MMTELQKNGKSQVRPNFSSLYSASAEVEKFQRQPAMKHTRIYTQCVQKKLASYIFLIQISLTFISMPTKNIFCFPWAHKHSSPRSHASCMPCLALINHFNSISGEIALEMVSRFLCWHGREWGLNHAVRFDLSALDWNREGPRDPRRSCNLDWPQQMDGQQSDSCCNQFSLESDMNQRSSGARLRPVWVCL